MENDRITQKSEVLKSLLKGRKISPLAALQKWGCFRLSSIIHTLRGAGYPIKTGLTAHPDKEGCQFASYYIDPANLDAANRLFEDKKA